MVILVLDITNNSDKKSHSSAASEAPAEGFFGLRSILVRESSVVFIMLSAVLNIILTIIDVLKLMCHFYTHFKSVKLKR